MEGRCWGDRVSQYIVYITPSALRELKKLPGNMRQRAKRAIENLANEPHPSGSKALNVANCDAWRLRLDRWRIIYTVTETDKIIDVLGIRKRPPYDYQDLETLLNETE